MEYTMGSVLLFLAAWVVLRIVRSPYDYQHMKTFLGYESEKLKAANEEIARQRRILVPMLPDSLRSILIALATVIVLVYSSIDAIGFFLLSQTIVTNYIFDITLITLATISAAEAMIGTQDFYRLITLILTTDKDETVIERYVKIHTIKLFPNLTITILHICAVVLAVYGLVCVVVAQCL